MEQHRANACAAERIDTAIHPGLPELNEHLGIVGGLDLDVPTLPVRLPGLPRVIPRVRPSGVGTGVDLPVLAVALRDVLSRSGRFAQVNTLVKRLKIRRGTRVILFCCGDDQLLEACFENIHEFATVLRESGLDCVSSVAFSIYYRRSPLEGFYNQKRNLVTLKVFQDAGLNAFPMISWRFERDIKRVQDWLWRNPLVKYVGVDFQDAKGSRGWESLKRGFAHLTRFAPPDLRYIAYGVSAEGRIADLVNVTDRVHFVSEQAYMKATKGVTPPGVGNQLGYRMKRHLFKLWVEYQEAAVRQALASRPATP